MTPANQPNNGLHLAVHLCELKSDEESWSATIAVEGPVEAQGTVVGIFYEGRRQFVGELDEWGYLITELENLPIPQALTKSSHFEVRTKSPPASFVSDDFQPPIIPSALKDFLEKTRHWPDSLSLRDAQLQGASLGQSVLKGVDLTGADLTGAKLWGADLTGAILKNAILDNVDFNEAKLVRADLQNAKANNASWEKVKLKGADLRGISGLPVKVIQEWSELVTLDETQLARVKLANLAKREEENRSESHYSSKKNTLMPISVEQNPPIASPETVIRHDPRFYLSPEEMGWKKPQEEEEEEEVCLWLPKLPPLPKHSDEYIEQLFETEEKLYQSKLKKYQQNRTLRGGIEFSLNMIPNGIFEMGDDEGEVKERPRHKVKLSYPLLVGETLVTQELYERVMRHSNFKFVGATNPADTVSWSEAIDFCNRLSQLEGLKPAYEVTRKGLKWIRGSNGYRLPTEAEWEYFARAAIYSKYSGSNNLDVVGWYKENSEEKSHPVARKRPNAWGLYDVSGNLWEWCFDTYQETAYHERGVEPVVDPVIEGEGPKVIRGGSWSYEEEGLRIIYRSRLSAKFKTSRVGFRIVRSPKLKAKGE